MGAACFKAVAEQDAVSATSTESKAHPELTSTSPDAKHGSTFHSSHGPKSSGTKSPGSKRRRRLESTRPASEAPELLKQQDSEPVLVADDSILSCNCSDVIASPPVGPERLEPPLASMPSSREAPPCVEWDQSGNSHPFERPGTKAGEVDTHGTFAVRREADQLKRHKDQFEEFVMKYAEPEECVPSLSEPGIRMLDVGQLTGATVELDHIDSPTNSIDAPDHDSARFAPSPAAEASLSEHRGKSPEAASGILGLRDPSLLESPFADSDAGDVVDGDSAFEKLLGPGDSRKQPGKVGQRKQISSARDHPPPFKLPFRPPNKAGQQKQNSPAQKQSAVQDKDAHDAEIEAAIAAAAAAAEELEEAQTRRFSDFDSQPSPSRSRSSTPPPQVVMQSMPGTWSPEQLQAMLVMQSQMVRKKQRALQRGGGSSMMGSSSNLGGSASLMGGGGSSMMMGPIMGFPSQMGVPMMPGFATPPSVDQILKLKHHDAMQRSSSLGLRVSADASPMLHALLGRDKKGRPSANNHAQARPKTKGHKSGMARTRSAGMAPVPPSSMLRSPPHGASRTASRGQVAHYDRSCVPHSTGHMGHRHMQRLASAPVTRTGSMGNMSIHTSQQHASASMDGVTLSAASRQHTAESIGTGHASPDGKRKGVPRLPLIS